MEDRFRFADDFGPARIVHIYRPSVALNAIVVVDNTACGAAVGGVRMAPDVSVEECFRLARAMTWKNAAAGLPHGGGKSVIFGDPRMPPAEKEQLIRAFANAIRDIVDYIPGPDMGTDEHCMAWIKDETGRAVGLPSFVGGIPLDEIGATGFGLAACVDIAREFIGLDLKGAPKQVMVPMFARVRRVLVEERLGKLAVYADGEFPYNSMEINDPSIGFISTGVTSLYTREVFPQYSFLKLGMVWPLPRKLISEFCEKVEKVIIVEELDPFLETEIKAMGCKVHHGKDLIPAIGELTPTIIERSLSKAVAGKEFIPPQIRMEVDELPKRPPNLCAGCSHRPLFYALKKLGLFVFGDIGCYALSVAPPLSAMHFSTCMGAGIGGAYGAAKVLRNEGLGKMCAVLGDSTFLHSGIGPLMDSVYNGGYSTTIILDNRITAMTGQQEHPGTGFTLRGDPASSVDYEQLARAVGVKQVRTVDPYNIKETIEIIREEVNRDEASVIITKNSPCMLLRRTRPRDRFEYPSYAVDEEMCMGCRLCLEINCPAISWVPKTGKRKDGRKRKGTAHINRDQCVGCAICTQICEFEGIVPQPE